MSDHLKGATTVSPQDNMQYAQLMARSNATRSCRSHTNPIVGCDACEALRYQANATYAETPTMTAQERAAYDEFKAASLDLKAKKAAYDEAAVRVRDAINEMANAAAGAK